jgi:hypothetical protein
MPKPDEILVLTQSFDRLHQQYQESPAEADLILKQGSTPRDESINAAVHAAFTGVCLVLFNLDETLTHE